MASVGSNSIEIRRVMQREPAPDGGYTYFENLQYRTKDVTASLLGLIPLASSWSPWQSLDRTDLIYVDESGNPL